MSRADVAEDRRRDCFLSWAFSPGFRMVLPRYIDDNEAWRPQKRGLQSRHPSSVLTPAAFAPGRIVSYACSDGTVSSGDEGIRMPQMRNSKARPASLPFESYLHDINETTLLT